MKLTDALKANRPIKRKEWGEYFIPSTERAVFMVQDVVAEDWEVEETKVTITFIDFSLTWNKVMSAINKMDNKVLDGWTETTIYLLLKKELGL